jgi:5,5'-dehydrodivanillate O-demethylase
VSYSDFVHTGPGTLAGRFMRMFWQPVYRSQDLPAGRAKPIKIMGEEFTLYRGEGGTAHVIAQRCAHRQTQLSVGSVEGDCIRCFYHGWKYDALGQCVEQPAEEPGFAARIRIRSYPTEEYLGLIFAFLGEGSPPPLMRFPELETEGIIENHTFVRACNFFRHLELDPGTSRSCIEIRRKRNRGSRVFPTSNATKRTMDLFSSRGATTRYRSSID